MKLFVDLRQPDRETSGMVPLPKAYGLTGGIASGKSTVCQFFREMKVAVIEADHLSREVCKVGEAGWKKIKETFGEDYFTSSQELDRKKMANLIFSDAQMRKKLEDILHPLIIELGRREIRSYFDQGEGLVLFEAALLMETEFDLEFHGTIVVSCTREQQIERLCQRDGITKEKALQIIEAQWPLDRKVELATFVIDNSDTLQSTLEQTREVFEKIKAKQERKSPLWH